MPGKNAAHKTAHQNAQYLQKGNMVVLAV
jgi:hypothetical protein